MNDPVRFIAKRARSACPRCGAPNACAVEQGKSIQACWCFHVDLAIDPVETEGAACFCRRCATAEAADATPPA